MRWRSCFFCFFYTALVFNSKETADNLKKSGAFVPGIRPGEQTARYIDKILMRLTLAGAVYITLVCLLPEFMHAQWKVPVYFGGTSLLIVVVVTMDFMAQVQNYVMSQQYESLLRKANFKGGIPYAISVKPPPGVSYGKRRRHPECRGDSRESPERNISRKAGKRARGTGPHISGKMRMNYIRILPATR
jgi:hypothetical protein